MRATSRFGRIHPTSFSTSLDRPLLFIYLCIRRPIYVHLPLLFTYRTLSHLSHGTLSVAGERRNSGLWRQIGGFRRDSIASWTKLWQWPMSPQPPNRRHLTRLLYLCFRLTFLLSQRFSRLLSLSSSRSSPPGPCYMPLLSFYFSRFM